MRSRLLTISAAILLCTLSAAFTSLVSANKNSDHPFSKADYKEWMPKNLDVSKFANGDPIPQAKTTEEWKNAGINKQPAWCYYNNDAKNNKKYGKLYNWHAVNDPRGLAPKGWHVPSDAEWNNFPANCVAGGIRGTNNSFRDIDTVGFWWSATAVYRDEAWCRILVPNLRYVKRLSHKPYIGMSVRCIKD